MKKLWLFLVGIMMLAACSDEIPETPTPDVPGVEGRTMLAYLVSNNANGDLDDYLKYNVVDMYKGLINSKQPATLLVYYRPRKSDTSLDGPSILKFVSDGKGRINGKQPLNSSELQIDDNFKNAQRVAKTVFGQAEITETDSPGEIATDPEVMTGVLKKMVKMVPSDSYGLAMGSHGTGWLKASRTTTGRSFGDDNGYSIDIPELAGALKEAFTDKKLDFILFDACMMANAEVAYELRDVTDYMIASVLETPALGFPYSSFFNELYADDVDYQFICDQFIEINRKNGSWGTCAAVDCKQMQKLADWVKSGLAVNAKGLNKDFPSKVVQYGRFSGGFGNFSFDVVDVFRQLMGHEPEALIELMKEVVVAKNCIEDNGRQFPYVAVDKDRFCGIGMYLPNLVGKTNWDAYYLSSLAWPKAIAWNYY